MSEKNKKKTDFDEKNKDDFHDVEKHSDNADDKHTHDCRCEHDHKCHCEHKHDHECDCEHDKCKCDDDCKCGDDCKCDKHCHCHESNEHIKEINLDYLDLAQRLKAEFDNYKKRNAELATTSFNDGKAFVISKLLPVIDAFDQANKTITDENVKAGVNIINNQLRNILTDLGVKKIDCVGKEFDPYLHNAVFAVEGEGKSNIVLEELQEGFTLDGKVLRHSVVKISK